MKHAGFSLIECTLVIGIAVASCVFAMTGVRHFIYTHNANTTMQQLQQSISLARSIAIARNCQVTIYPQDKSLTLKIAGLDLVKHLNLNVGAGDELLLLQSGFSNKSLTIQADGMTYTNGHFNYKSRKANSLPQFNLYFNRALRTYVLVSG
jgi:type II secretory pathway pseudopilin PulG